MIKAIRRMALGLVDEWVNDASRMYLSALINTMSWKVALAVALSLFISVAQGAQILLLIPLMQLLGLDVQQGTVGKLSDFVTSAFAAVGLRPTLLAVLGFFVVLSTALALITRWQTTFQSRFLMDFIIDLRRRLYRAIARCGSAYLLADPLLGFHPCPDDAAGAGRPGDRRLLASAHQRDVDSSSTPFSRSVCRCR